MASDNVCNPQKQMETLWFSLQQPCVVAHLWSTQNACRWPCCVVAAVQIVTRPRMHPQLQWPIGWQTLLCAGYLHVLINTSYSEVTTDECGWKTMTSGCATFEMHLYCVSVWGFSALSLCVGGVWPWLDAASYALWWGALDLQTAVKLQEQPCREPLINSYHVHYTALFLLYGSTEFYHHHS